MSDGATDDSNITSGKPAIEELTRSSCSTSRVVLAFWTVPMFLFYLCCLFVVFDIIDTDSVWEDAGILVRALVFVICGMIVFYAVVILILNVVVALSSWRDRRKMN